MKLVVYLQNYQGCFQNDSLEEVANDDDLSAPYEIMNRSGAAGLVFTETTRGLYVLHVRVVQPGYRYVS